MCLSANGNSTEQAFPLATAVDFGILITTIIVITPTRSAIAIGIIAAKTKLLRDHGQREKYVHDIMDLIIGWREFKVQY